LAIERANIAVVFGGDTLGMPNMRLALNKDYVDRVNGAARGLLWTLLGVCVLAATAYDLRHWITAW
jgi:hypothetical protein